MIKWKTPVTDRAYEDALNKTPAFYLNKRDLNRIEGNIDYLSVALYYEDYGIKRILPMPKSWRTESIPTTADIERICKNIKSLAIAYSYDTDISGYGENLLKKLLKTSSTPLDIDNVNYLEEVLSGICGSLGAGQPFNTWGDLKDLAYWEDLRTITYRDLQTIQFP